MVRIGLKALWGCFKSEAASAATAAQMRTPGGAGFPFAHPIALTVDLGATLHGQEDIMTGPRS